MTLVLVIDDVPAVAEQYAYDLKRIGGYETLIATGGAAALELLAAEPVDCVILDLEMPGTDGFQVLRTLHERGLDVPVIVYTGTGSYDRCAQAIRLGAYSFIDKAEPMERVVRDIENALEHRSLAGEVRALRRRLDGDTALLGAAPPMKQLRDEIARIAPIPSPVLIVGESGSGKELVAREIHRLGAVAKAPFLAINSAAIPETLIESELFGHERGAFTGASQLHKGAFESAGTGTLFLDEIGELPGAAQAKLLRIIEERQVTRLGGQRSIPVRARVVAATHRDLEADVEEGRFRQDLYFRIAVHVLRVPPLREHISDLPQLAEHILFATCARFGVRPRSLGEDALHILMAYDWRRNNVRELRNILERMILAADGHVLGREHVPPEIRTAIEPENGSPDSHTFLALKTEAERRIVLEALERNEWHITRTAQELGLADHASLLKIMRRLGVSRP